jgi:regulator of RNase E activity RraA
MKPVRFTDENRARLRAVSTATLTTALFKRGFRNTYMQDVQPLNPSARMVGEAYTMRYIPAREDLDVLSAFEDPEHPQRKAVEEIPPGSVFVIDSRRDRRAASAGSILLTRLMVRGIAGVVTDGGFRDSPEIARLGIPAYAVLPSAPTNLIHHHAVDLDVPIGCGDVAVFPGDIIVGDAEGVVVIPAEIANEVTEEAFGMTLFENWVTAQVKAGASIRGLYPANSETRIRYEAWRAGAEGEAAVAALLAMGKAA